MCILPGPGDVVPVMAKDSEGATNAGLKVTGCYQYWHPENEKPGPVRGVSDIDSWHALLENFGAVYKSTIKGRKSGNN